MAFLTAQGISSVAIELLSRSLVLPMTVTRIPGAEFSGPNGSTISVRVPVPRTANTQNAGGGSLTPADVDEVEEQVSISHLYDLVNLDEYELNLDIDNFASQVTRLQVEAVARGAEDTICTAMNGLSADLEFALTASAADTKDVVVAARQALSTADAPADNRYLAVSPSITSRLLKVEEFVRVDASGASSALREAVIGRIFGMTVVESNGLTADTAVAYHKSGFVFANRPPAIPRGANDAAISTAQGISLRQLFQYDAGTAQDQSLVSTFAGATAVADNESANSLDDFPRSVKIEVASS